MALPGSIANAAAAVARSAGSVCSMAFSIAGMGLSVSLARIASIWAKACLSFIAVSADPENISYSDTPVDAGRGGGEERVNGGRASFQARARSVERTHGPHVDLGAVIDGAPDNLRRRVGRRAELGGVAV